MDRDRLGRLFRCGPGGEGGVPLQGGGLPGVWRSDVAVPETVDEIVEEDKLRAGEQDRRGGHVDVQGDGGCEQSTGGVGDLGELGVVAGFAGEAGKVHGKEGVVGAEEGEPEVPAAEALGQETAGSVSRGGEQGEPVVGGGEEAEDSGHGHDEVEVRDDEEGVVEVLVEYGLREHGAGEASNDEERDEAEGEEHRRGVLRARAPDGGDPAEDFGGGGERDGECGDGEGSRRKGIQPGDEHVMPPEQDPEHTDGEGGRNHHPPGDDGTPAEVGEHHGGKSEAGEDGDVDLGVSEEPEEMKPEERAAVAGMSGGVDDSADGITGRDEEGCAGVAVAEEKQQGGEQDGEGEDTEERCGEPSPDGKREAIPRHAFAAQAHDGDERVDGADGGRDGEEGDAEKPEIHAEALSRAGGGDGAQWRIGCPAGDRRSLKDKRR